MPRRRCLCVRILPTGPAGSQHFSGSYFAASRVVIAGSVCNERMLRVPLLCTVLNDDF
jgi:hypothetical protein